MLTEGRAIVLRVVLVDRGVPSLPQRGAGCLLDRYRDGLRAGMVIDIDIDIDAVQL